MTLTSHADVLGSRPPWAEACSCFYKQSQTFKAKIRPFLWMKFENILPSYSAYLQSSTVANVRSRTGLLLFGTFELSIFMPFKVGKFCIPQKKALLPIVWKKFWNWMNFCRERLQMSFSRGSTFSLKGAWPCSGSCNTQFHTWFKKLYFRAFKWDIIGV